MAEYKFFKKQDKYFITNEDTDTITYIIKQSQNCVDFYDVFDGEILPGVTQEVILEGDDIYQVIVDNTDTILIKKYLYLLLSIIEGITENICNCECGCDCEDDDKEKELCNLLMLRAKLDAYKRLINPDAVSFFDAVNKHTICLIEKPIYCAVNEEAILGEANCNLKLTKQLIALDYLALYFFELKQTCLSEDACYVSEKFNTNQIFCCIQSLGIDVGEIETLINDNMGTLTINNGAYVNLPPSAVGDNTIAVANRAVTILTLDMFTTNTTPAYSDPEGDLPAAVRINILPQDGVLKLNGVNVTASQVITVADINNSLLTYESPNQDALDTDAIDFSVSDAGSGLFTT